MDKEEKVFGVQRNVFLFGLVSLLNDFSSEMAQAVMPVFITSVLGAPPVFLGFLEGMAEALSAALKFASGFFSDREGKRVGQAAVGYAIAVAARFFTRFPRASGRFSGFGLRIAWAKASAPRRAML